MTYLLKEYSPLTIIIQKLDIQLILDLSLGEFLTT